MKPCIKIKKIPINLKKQETQTIAQPQTISQPQTIAQPQSQTIRQPCSTYKCVKLPLRKIIQDQQVINQLYNEENQCHIIIENMGLDRLMGVINDAVIRTNKIIVKTNLLLRSWVLSKYPDIPEITINLIKMAVQVICSPKDAPRPTKTKKYDNPSGRQKAQDRDRSYRELQSLNPFPMENNQYLSGILEYQYTMIFTAIENNIKYHFPDYLRKYVNVVLHHQYIETLIDTPSKKQFSRDIAKVKSDLLQNRTPLQYTSDPKFHVWMGQQHPLILPQIQAELTYPYEVHVDPFKYLKYMIYMNREIEHLGGRMFQMFPLRDDIVPKHIQIDTKALIELLISQGNAYLLKHVRQCQDVIWKTYFKDLPNRKNYVFDHAMITDGVSVSVRLIDFKEWIKKDRVEENKRQGRLLAKERRKQGLDPPVKEKKVTPKKRPPKPPEFFYIDEVSKDLLQGHNAYSDNGKKNLFSMIDDQDHVFNYSNRQRIHETKRFKYQQLLENFRSRQGVLSIERELSGYNSKTCDFHLFQTYMMKKIEINEQLYQLYAHQKYRQYRWYGYLNRLRSEDHLVTKILNMSNQTPRSVGASHCHRKHHVRGHKSSRKINRQDLKSMRQDQIQLNRLGHGHGQHRMRLKNSPMNDPEIRSMEDSIRLLDETILTLDHSIIESKNKIRRLHKTIREEKHFQPKRTKRTKRKSHHHHHRHRTHHDPKEKQKFQMSAIIMGDWSIGKQMRHFISTPNLHLKRKIAEKVPVYDLDEFRTSCLYYGTEVLCDNLYLPDLTGQERKLHSVLTYQLQKRRLGCINRDSNGRQNIRKLFHSYMDTGDRPERYRRGTILK